MAEEAKVTLATMHLTDDVKLGWRSKYMDIQDSQCTVDTWDNVGIITRRKLRELKHTGKYSRLR